jgi:hypothetical protein
MLRRIVFCALAAIGLTAYSGEASAKHHHPRLFVYNTKGITILANTNLGVNSALGVTDQKAYTTSFWLQGSVLRRNLYTTEQQTELWSDPASHCEADGSAPGWCFAVDEDDGTFQFNFNNSAGTDGTHFVLHAPADANWHHYLLSFDNHAGLAAAYVDNVLDTSFIHVPTDVVVNLNNSAGFHLGPEGPGLEYQAEWVIAGTPAVCSGAGSPSTMFGMPVTCSGANVIPPEVRAGFIDGSGGPVDLGMHCKAPFNGNFSPEVCIRDSSFHNSGSGADLAAGAWTGTIDNPTVYHTGYGPAGIPAHQVSMRWLQHAFYATIPPCGSPCFVTKDHFTTDADGNPISSGNLIVIGSGISNSSGSTTNYHMGCPAGFTAIGPVVDAPNLVNSIVCWKIAGSSETGAYAITFDRGNGTRDHDWLMAVYDNVASVDQTGSNYNSSATTTHNTASGLTTTAGNETVISFLANENAGANGSWTFPSTGNPEYRVPDNVSPLQFMLADEYGVASGQNPQRAFHSGGSDQSAGYTITVAPN